MQLTSPVPTLLYSSIGALQFGRGRRAGAQDGVHLRHGLSGVRERIAVAALGIGDDHPILRDHRRTLQRPAIAPRLAASTASANWSAFFRLSSAFARLPSERPTGIPWIGPRASIRSRTPASALDRRACRVRAPRGIPAMRRRAPPALVSRRPGAGFACRGRTPAVTAGGAARIGVRQSAAGRLTTSSPMISMAKAAVAAAIGQRCRRMNFRGPVAPRLAADAQGLMVQEATMSSVSAVTDA